MNKTTPAKHKTPNYRLKTYTYEAKSLLGGMRTYSFSKWEPVPLRATRKDL